MKTIGLNKETVINGEALIISTKVTIRNISQADIARIVQLQREIYPEVASGQFYAPFFIEKHLRVFPEGQFCVEMDGQIVGSATNLIVTLEPEHREHTWHDIVGYGNTTSYDRNGDSLYADDIITHPSYRRQGIGTALMKARKELCIKTGLRRIIGGGRLYNYCFYANLISPHEYAKRVVGNELGDPVLTFQLRNEFKYIKILPNYIRDIRSLNFASLIEWTRPT
jgi:GNAT superfamily N-acetyltransferase